MNSPSVPPVKRQKQSSVSDFFSRDDKFLSSDIYNGDYRAQRTTLPVVKQESEENQQSEQSEECYRFAKSVERHSYLSARENRNTPSFNVDKIKKIKMETSSEDQSEESSLPNPSDLISEYMKAGPSSQISETTNASETADSGATCFSATNHLISDSSNSTDSDEVQTIIRNKLAINLNQTPQEIPTDMPRFPYHFTWTTGKLESSSNHSVLIKGTYVEGLGPMNPTPSTLDDKWDAHHVKMPYSEKAKYNHHDGQSSQRWDLIEISLCKDIPSFQEFHASVSRYNSGYSWDFEELEDFLEEMPTVQRRSFFSDLLPAIIRLALSLPTICTQSIPLLAAGKPYSITISQRQAACLLANAFLCTFPRRNTTKSDSQFTNYPTINFHTLFNRTFKETRRQCRKAKLRCILNYFQQVTTSMPEGNITFSRIRINSQEGWDQSQAQFQKVFITSEGLIEDEGAGMLMVDFANRKVGGGVLRNGCVQEEILFVIYPELICARLFTEALGNNEALIVSGVERFNSYEGYSSNFIWTGNVTDTTPRDSWGRRYTQIVAIDAEAFRGRKQQKAQFTQKFLMRELTKAFAGFQTPGFPRTSIATGNWGCGAFGGDARLKFLIQWMAASRAGRPLTYFTFNDHNLMCELRALYDLIQRQNIAICDLLLLLKRYDRLYISSDVKKCPELVDFLNLTFRHVDSV